MSEQDYLTDILDYLSAKGVRDDCAACGQNNWYIPKEIAMTEFARKENKPPPGILPTLVMICNNCGYVQQFSFMAFMHWMHEVGRSDKVSVQSPEAREE